MAAALIVAESVEKKVGLGVPEPPPPPAPTADREVLGEEVGRVLELGQFVGAPDTLPCWGVEDGEGRLGVGEDREEMVPAAAELEGVPWKSEVGVERAGV